MQRIYVIERRNPLEDWGLDEASSVFSDAHEAEQQVREWNDDYPEMEHRFAACILEDQSPIPALTKALQHVKREWQHNVPSDCYSTGPCTGDIVQDYVACPGCAVQREIDAALALVEASNGL